MRKINKIEATRPSIPTRKKVAAYARVSRDTERLNHSLSAQISYYSKLIQSNPAWEYAGVYADEGITGTSISKRTEFQRLIDDCTAGKIDIILVKSISRFGRNTVDVLNTTRYLKELGIEVRFEEQNINSLSGDGELMLTILSSFAEEESKSLSANVRWANQKKAEKGEMLNAGAPYGYQYDRKNRTLIVVPEEAEIIKEIFHDYLDLDLSVYKIAEKLNAAGIPSPRGARWAQCTLRRIIQNPTYIGDLLLGKFYSDGPMTQKRLPNRGERPQYYVEGAHEAIIDKTTFEKVQEKFKHNTEFGAYRSGTFNCFSRTIICKGCGKPFGRAMIKRSGEKCPAWVCKARADQSRKCPTVSIFEDDLKNEIAKMLNLTEFTENEYICKVDHLEVDLDDYIHLFQKNGTEKVFYYPRRRRSPQTKNKEE